MLTATKVGVAPGTSTIRITHPLGEVPELTPEQHAAADIHLRARQLEIQRSNAKWSAIGAVATAGLTVLAIGAAVGAWYRTGKLQVRR